MLPGCWCIIASHSALQGGKFNRQTAEKSVKKGRKITTNTPRKLSKTEKELYILKYRLFARVVN